MKKDNFYVWWSALEERAYTFNDVYGEPVYIFGDEELEEEKKRAGTMQEEGYEIRNIDDIPIWYFYSCPFCEDTFNVDELNWVNPVLKICDECYGKIPTQIIARLEKEDADAFEKARIFALAIS